MEIGEGKIGGEPLTPQQLLFRILNLEPDMKHAIVLGLDENDVVTIYVTGALTLKNMTYIASALNNFVQYETTKNLSGVR